MTGERGQNVLDHVEEEAVARSAALSTENPGITDALVTLLSLKTVTRAHAQVSVLCAFWSSANIQHYVKYTLILKEPRILWMRLTVLKFTQIFISLFVNLSHKFN